MRWPKGNARAKNIVSESEPPFFRVCRGFFVMVGAISLQSSSARRHLTVMSASTELRRSRRTSIRMPIQALRRPARRLFDAGARSQKRANGDPYLHPIQMRHLTDLHLHDETIAHLHYTIVSSTVATPRT